LFALVRHPVLDRMPPPSARTRSMALRRDRFGVVDDPMQAVERNLALTRSNTESARAIVSP